MKNKYTNQNQRFKKIWFLPLSLLIFSSCLGLTKHPKIEEVKKLAEGIQKITNQTKESLEEVKGLQKTVSQAKESLEGSKGFRKNNSIRRKIRN